MQHFNKRLVKSFAAATVAFVSMPSVIGYAGLVFNEAVHPEVTREAAACSAKLSSNRSCSLKEQQALATKNKWQVWEDVALDAAMMPVAVAVMLM